VAVRRTSAADLPALYDIFSEAIGLVYRARRLDPPAPPYEIFAAQQRHLLTHDGDRCVVAEEDGEVVAFASAWARGTTWFLASLFVRPRVHGRGVGTALLDAVWGAEFASRRTITDAIQPISNALYGRRGLIPVAPVLPFAGTPVAAVRATGPLEQAQWDAAAAGALDGAGYGFDRSVDHDRWSAVARRVLWRDARGGAAAYSYAFPDGTIGPVVGADPAAAAAALHTELALADGEVRVRIPGSARDLVAVALATRLRLSPTPGLLLLDRATPAPAQVAIAGYTLL
jgi:GNAT superfamily N-acetyltransferase